MQCNPTEGHVYMMLERYQLKAPVKHTLPYDRVGELGYMILTNPFAILLDPIGCTPMLCIPCMPSLQNPLHAMHGLHPLGTQTFWGPSPNLPPNHFGNHLIIAHPLEYVLVCLPLFFLLGLVYVIEDLMIEFIILFFLLFLTSIFLSLTCLHWKDLCLTDYTWRNH